MPRIVVIIFLLIGVPLHAQTEITPFARNVLTHVILHELGHALIREFDLPVLGNEENMADTFATLYIARNMPGRAEDIIRDRAISWLIQTSEISPEDYDLKDEHDLDARRAYQAVCLLYGVKRNSNNDNLSVFEISEGVADDCAAFAPELERGWRRVLAPLMMPGNEKSDGLQIFVGEGPLEDAMRTSEFLDDMGEIIRGFDWHSRITLHFDHCDGGATWSRSERRILLCDRYVMRFLEQGERAAQ